MKTQNKYKMKNIATCFVMLAVFLAFNFNATAQDECLNICPGQGASINVSGDDSEAINGVVCIDNLTGDNYVIQNGDLSDLPEAIYSCYVVAVTNSTSANFNIASVTYTIDNINLELETVLLDTEECGNVSETPKTLDINSAYCNIDCMLDVCLCNESSGTNFVFDYEPANNLGDNEEFFIVVDSDDIVVAIASGSPISAMGLTQGSYNIHAVIYDSSKGGNLPTILNVGNALSDIENEINATACGSISAAINASVNASACGCEPPTPVSCLTDICPCKGDVNEIKLSTSNYTTDGNNEQWYVVISGGNIVTTQQAASNGSVVLAGLPDGNHEIYAVNYDPVSNANIESALAIGNAWASFTEGLNSGNYCADFIGPQDISINDNGLCNCDDPMPPTCNNNAGTMPSQSLNVCNGSIANATTVGAAIDAGSVLTYVLHNGVNDAIGTVIEENTTGVFMNFGSFPTGLQLYICAVVSPDTGGFPNLDADCTSISNCTPVTFLSPIQVDENVDCSGSGNYSVIFKISGGTPASQAGSIYNVSGDYTGVVAPNTATTAGPFNAGSFYSLNISDANGCNANIVSQKILCEKLPIELIRYSGEVKANGNMLKWLTATETENDYFTLGRSTDGINFKLINTQKGAGTTNESQAYNYLDRTAPNGISYYKLSQTDFDGTMHYVDLIALNRGEASLAINSLLPIPVLNFLELTYTSISESQVELQIYDALGKQLAGKTMAANLGLNMHNLDVSAYPPGMYFLTINQAKATITEKFIKE